MCVDVQVSMSKSKLSRENHQRDLRPLLHRRGIPTLAFLTGLLTGIGQKLLLELHGRNHAVKVPLAVGVGVFREARDSEHDVILLHKVANAVATRENRSKTSS